MVPLDLPPLIKGSLNEYRGSGRRKLGRMDASSKKMIVVWLIEKQNEKKDDKKKEKQDDDRNINGSVI